jgi:hypothetical protein
MPSFRVAGTTFELTPQTVEHAVERVLPEPIHEHYVVVCGRRYPPKQVLVEATGLDRADFTTHQARRILKRLGFVAARSHGVERTAVAEGTGPHGGGQAAELERYTGQSAALASPTEVLVAADTRPAIPVQVEDLEEAPQLCLVDTGSYANRFGAWVADAVGVDLAGAPEEEVAIGGFVTKARQARADLTVAGTRYDAPISFCDPWPRAVNLLGQEGFLRFFRVTFCAKDFWLEVEPEVES